MKATVYRYNKNKGAGWIGTITQKDFDTIMELVIKSIPEQEFYLVVISSDIKPIFSIN